MTFSDASAIIQSAVQTSKSRKALLLTLFKQLGAGQMAEIGVWKGDLAQAVLNYVPNVERYILVDPWRNLPDWNKPLNKSDIEFDAVRAEALSKVAPFQQKVVELRASTKEARAQIADGSLDLVYIDGDHTLRGITIDLISLLPKVRPGGFIVGDDFSKTIWQHSTEYSPTEVFPFAVYFAEAHDLPIFTLPFNQFVIINEQRGFEVIDLGGYASLTPADIYAPPKGEFVKSLARRLPPSVQRLLRRVVSG
ncbi:class I SAM-dependent methyltransferase [Roseinatronobacter sp.]|uniref:class I SAM-dependent methyltransferase n=1 Tax=Roseinatronobacter sp. TaxID=1945755 RepID=UPI0025DB0C1A|nr:class I SAM-dependent methyltransferase [Roseibaca sp.]